MVSTGRALMTHPDLLILDEATEGLAPLVAHEIWRILKTVRERGNRRADRRQELRALSVVTDRNVILVKGQVVFAGSSAELRARPELLRQHLGI
jgi:branched-chain amino acid transport system ATP-binding protein